MLQGQEISQPQPRPRLPIRQTASNRPHAYVEGALRPRRRYRARTDLHSLHFNSLVVTSVAISAGFSTGSGQVAQLAEHAAENRGVGSSILPLATSRTTEPSLAGRLRCVRD